MTNTGVSCETGFCFDITETGTEGSFETIRNKKIQLVLSEYTETGTFRFFWLFGFDQKRAERTEITRRQRDKGKGKGKRGGMGRGMEGMGKGKWVG